MCDCGFVAIILTNYWEKSRDKQNATLHNEASVSAEEQQDDAPNEMRNAMTTPTFYTQNGIIVRLRRKAANVWALLPWRWQFQRLFLTE